MSGMSEALAAGNGVRLSASRAAKGTPRSCAICSPSAQPISTFGSLGSFERSERSERPERFERHRGLMRRWLVDVTDHVRVAVRQLRSAPAFTLVAAVPLAFGIGANSAIFALVDATLLRPLPFDDPGRLVAIWERTDRSARGEASPI